MFKVPAIAESYGDSKNHKGIIKLDFLKLD